MWRPGLRFIRMVKAQCLARLLNVAGKLGEFAGGYGDCDEQLILMCRVDNTIARELLGDLRR